MAATPDPLLVAQYILMPGFLTDPSGIGFSGTQRRFYVHSSAFREKRTQKEYILFLYRE